VSSTKKSIFDATVQITYVHKEQHRIRPVDKTDPCGMPLNTSIQSDSERVPLIPTLCTLNHSAVYSSPIIFSDAVCLSGRIIRKFSGGLMARADASASPGVWGRAWTKGARPPPPVIRALVCLQFHSRLWGTLSKAFEKYKTIRPKSTLWPMFRQSVTLSRKASKFVEQDPPLWNPCLLLVWRSTETSRFACQGTSRPGYDLTRHPFLLAFLCGTLPV